MLPPREPTAGGARSARWPRHRAVNTRSYPPWVLERGPGWLRAAHAMLTQHPPTPTTTTTAEPPAPSIQRIPVRATDATR